MRLIFDYIESMLAADRFLAPSDDLAEYVFNFYDWDARPHDAHQPPPAPAPDSRVIAILSHADTDLLTLEQARGALPPGVDVVGISLGAIRSDEQMALVLDGGLAGARVVVLRIHGEVSGVTGFDRLQQRCRERDQALVVVSGTGELSPALVRAGSVAPDVNETVTTYLMLGGVPNVAECVRFLSDRLLLTGHGYVAAGGGTGARCLRGRRRVADLGGLGSDG